MKVLNESRQPTKAIDESNALKVMIDAFNDIGDAIEYLKGEE